MTEFGDQLAEEYADYKIWRDSKVDGNSDHRISPEPIPVFDPSMEYREYKEWRQASGEAHAQSTPLLALMSEVRQAYLEKDSIRD